MSLPQTLIVGIGSPHGDDRVGWLVADRLAARSEGDHINVRQAKAPIDLLDWLQDVDRLIVCDACRGLGHVGEVCRWQWPTSDMSEIAWSGTHDLSLPVALALGQRLGRLPQEIVVWGIEGAARNAVEDLSTGVLETVPELVDRIVHDLNDSA